MKKYTKSYIFAIILALVLVSGCVQQVPQGQSLNMPVPGNEYVRESIVVEETIKTPETKEEAKAEPKQEASGKAVREFSITAKRFEFVPSMITVKKGDKVKLTITSTDTTHGFSLPDFNINKALEPNQPVDVEFVADKVGTFTFKCNVPCGSGHSSMKGTLIVE